MSPPTNPDELNYVHFLTFSCHKKLHLLSEDFFKDLLQSYLVKYRDSGYYLLHAYVIMPKHVHLLISPKKQISRILYSIKRPFSFKAIRYLEDRHSQFTSQIQVKTGTTWKHQFWMRGGGYDHWVEEHESLLEIADYIHGNPVRWELVEYPEDWNWSSAGFWLKGEGDTVMDPFR
ncbi:MAG: hypothetical protein MAG453_01315 [Calditrichaeota bacterium]|nr:hypothetical protein [Calditrichota bacterium]